MAETHSDDPANASDAIPADGADALPVDDDLDGTFESIDALVDDVAREAGVDLDAEDDPLDAVLEMVEQSMEEEIAEAEAPLAADLPETSEEAAASADDDDPFGDAVFETTDEALAGAGPADDDDGVDDRTGVGQPDDRRADAPSPAVMLRGVDVSLADDMDDLLTGSFETVSDVLSDVFEEEEITAVGHDGEDVFITADLDELRADDELLPELGRRKEADAPPSDSKPATAGTFVAPESIEEQLAEAVEATPVAADAVEPAPAVRAVEDDPIATDVEPDVPDESTLEVVSARRTVPLPEPGRAEFAAAADDDPDDADDESEENEGVSRSARLGALWTRLEPPLVLVLRAANAPLRKVPSGLRPVVDWVALSLVFWVPVVWIVAMFVIGR